jgi:hypothetical protein
MTFRQFRGSETTPGTPERGAAVKRRRAEREEAPGLFATWGRFPRSVP